MAEAKQPPNIVLILTDDMGYDDLAAYGNSEIQTPNIDRLCREGVTCTNAYVSAPICVPSRMGLLTGRCQQRFGVYDNVYGPERNRLWLRETTLADVLRDAGYRTGLVGKWHLSGNNHNAWDYAPPHTRGFEEFVGIAGDMSDYWAGKKLLSSLDVFPTVLAAAGIAHPEDRVCDGVDLLPYFTGGKSGDPHESLCWQQRHWPLLSERPPPSPGVHQFAVRRDHWKAVKLDQKPVVGGGGGRNWELYDLRRDPGELQDVATEYPDVVRELAEIFTNWQRRMHPPP